MSKAALRVLSILFLGWVTVAPMMQTSNSTLDKILGSATPNAFAECGTGSCNLYSFLPGYLQPIIDPLCVTTTQCYKGTNDQPLYEDPINAAHSGNLRLSTALQYNGTSGPNSIYDFDDSIIDPIVNTPVVLGFTTDGQCTTPATKTLTLGSGYVDVLVTAVDDIIVEAPTHNCQIDMTILSGNLSGNGAGYTFNISIIDNDVAPGTVIETTHDSVTLTENPAIAASLQQNSLAIPSQDTGSTSSTSLSQRSGYPSIYANQIFAKITTDDQCYVNALPNQFVSRTTTYIQSQPYNPANAFAWNYDAFFKGRSDDVTEGSHFCSVLYDYYTDYSSIPFKSETILVPMTDYRPFVDAQAPALLYEKPVDGQASTGDFKLKLLAQPSDTSPITASITLLNPDVCVLASSILVFDQSNWSQFQAIPVSAIKDGVFQPGTRDCNIKLSLVSPEAPPVTQVNGRFVLASSKRTPATLAALEYNNLSTIVTVKVLDADTLPQTGITSPWIFLSSVVLFVGSLLGSILTTRAYRSRLYSTVTEESPKVRL
jgi:hypothetical protein